MFKQNILAPVLVLTFLLAPVYTASAGMWSDLVDYFRPEEKQVKVETKKEFTQSDKAEAQDKYKVWRKAFDNKDASVLRKNSQALEFSEQELNYLAENQVQEADKVFLTNPKIDLKEGAMEIKGYLLKPLTGNSFVRIKLIESKQRDIDFKIDKAKYRGFYFPPFVANRLINKHGGEILNFLNHFADENNLSLKITENKIKFY